jgi:predicted nuclease of predicted toxin-antitoxin system
MLILFDNGTPRTLARYLIDQHTITEARAQGLEEFENGELLTVAKAAGFDVLVTTDKILRISRTFQAGS